MIKVLQVVGKLGLGGAETRLMELSRFASKAKYHFDFCVFEDGCYDEQVRNLGFGIVKCQLSRNIFNFSKQFREILKKGKYDAIHCHIYQFSGLPLRIAAKEGISKRIMHLRNTHGCLRKNLYRCCYNKLMTSWIKRYSTRIAAVSESAMEANMGQLWRDDSRMTVIYNGLNIERFKGSVDRLAVLAEFAIPPDSQIVIHVGSFHPQKDHNTLVHCAARVVGEGKGVHFVLVGSGALMSKIQNLVAVKRLGSHIHFAGSRKDVPRLLLASDCFIFPSKWEGLPGAVLEALAAGLPVVASDIAPMREIASQSDSVHLVSVGDAVAFARKTQEILSNLEKYKKSPGQIPERFRFEDYAQKMLSLYE